MWISVHEIFQCNFQWQIFIVILVIRPKKIKGLFALLAWKLGGSVCWFFFFFFFNLDAEEMQYHSCVCILGHAEPQNWFDPGVRSGCIPIYLVTLPFWDNYYIFWHFILTFLLKDTRLSIKKKTNNNNKTKHKNKKKPLLSVFFLGGGSGSVRKEQINIFFFFRPYQGLVNWDWASCPDGYIHIATN